MQKGNADGGKSRKQIIFHTKQKQIFNRKQKYLGLGSQRRGAISCKFCYQVCRRLRPGHRVSDRQGRDEEEHRPGNIAESIWILLLSIFQCIIQRFLQYMWQIFNHMQEMQKTHSEYSRGKTYSICTDHWLTEKRTTEARLSPHPVGDFTVICPLHVGYSVSYTIKPMKLICAYLAMASGYWNIRCVEKRGVGHYV